VLVPVRAPAVLARVLGMVLGMWRLVRVLAVLGVRLVLGGSVLVPVRAPAVLVRVLGMLVRGLAMPVRVPTVRCPIQLLATQRPRPAPGPPVPTPVLAVHRPTPAPWRPVPPSGLAPILDVPILLWPRGLSVRGPAIQMVPVVMVNRGPANGRHLPV
jgi:hypothetical protein